MEKIVKIGDQDVPLKSTAASLIRYKSNFGRDGLSDIFAFQEASKNGKVDIDKVDFDTFFRFMWVFAKSANPSISPMEAWLDQFELADVLQNGLTAVVDLMANTTATNVKPVKN